MNYTVLYVDDEPENLRSFYYVYRREFNIFTCGSVEEALRVLEENKVDLIITDQIMPRISGVEFLEMVAQRYPDKPPNRMIVSGCADNQDLDIARKDYGLFAIVSKPWDPQELQNIMNEAIEVCKPSNKYINIEHGEK